MRICLRMTLLGEAISRRQHPEQVRRFLARERMRSSDMPSTALLVTIKSIRELGECWARAPLRTSSVALLVAKAVHLVIREMMAQTVIAGLVEAETTPHSGTVKNRRNIGRPPRECYSCGLRIANGRKANKAFDCSGRHLSVQLETL
jgi:hypothetical protein